MTDNRPVHPYNCTCNRCTPRHPGEPSRTQRRFIEALQVLLIGGISGAIFMTILELFYE